MPRKAGAEPKLTDNELIRITAAFILLAAVVSAGPAWAATAGLCVLTLIFESVGTHRA